MGAQNLELHKDIKIHLLYGPISRDADSATTTAAINRAATNSGSLVFVFSCGALTASTTLTPSFTEADTLAGSYTAVANADLSATPTAFADTNDDTFQAIAYKGTKPYVKAVLTQAAHAAALVSIHAIEGRGNKPGTAAGIVAATV
jgi:hypothetical protein